MSGPADISVRRALRRDAGALAAEHPELADPAARERCAEWLAGDEHDGAVEPDHTDEHDGAVERRKEVEAVDKPL